MVCYQSLDHIYLDTNLFLWYLAVSGTKMAHGNMYWLLGKQFTKEDKYMNKKYAMSLGNPQISYLNETLLFVYCISSVTKNNL